MGTPLRRAERPREWTLHAPTGGRPKRRWRNTTEGARLVERLTRVDADTLNYELTVTDPETWTSPWTASVPLALNPEPMFEYACHEGNYSMPLMLGGQRNIELDASNEP